MNADHIAAALLIWAALAWLVVGLFRAVREPEPRSLPGALGTHAAQAIALANEDRDPFGPFIVTPAEVRAYVEAVRAQIDAALDEVAAAEAARLDDDEAVAAWLGGGAA